MRHQYGRADLGGVSMDVYNSSDLAQKVQVVEKWRIWCFDRLQQYEKYEQGPASAVDSKVAGVTQW